MIEILIKNTFKLYIARIHYLLLLTYTHTNNGFLISLIYIFIYAYINYHMK